MSRRRDERVARRLISVYDAQRAARRRLPRSVYRYIEGGRQDEVTSTGNNAALRRITFRPRMATSYPARELRRTVLGTELSMPIVLAPAGFQRLAHPEGEVAAARAAGDAGIATCVSTMASFSIGEITAATSKPVWYQLYFAGGRAAAELGIANAQQAGCRALVVTVDTAAVIGRERYLRHRVAPVKIGVSEAIKYAPEMITHLPWLLDFVRGGLELAVPNVRLARDAPPLRVLEAAKTLGHHPTPTWADFSWIREQWKGPLVAKGVLTAEDARCAVDAGASAIVVSNHGGNVFDGTPPTIEMLPEIVAAVGDDTEVLLDSGIRRGSDVIKALALGARAVLIGRAYFYALAAAGTPGVTRILEILRDDMDRTLANLGVQNVDGLSSSYVRLPATPG